MPQSKKVKKAAAHSQAWELMHSPSLAIIAIAPYGALIYSQ